MVIYSVAFGVGVCVCERAYVWIIKFTFVCFQATISCFTLLICCFCLPACALENVCMRARVFVCARASRTLNVVQVKVTRKKSWLPQVITIDWQTYAFPRFSSVVTCGRLGNEFLVVQQVVNREREINAFLLSMYLSLAKLPANRPRQVVMNRQMDREERWWWFRSYAGLQVWVITSRTVDGSGIVISHHSSHNFSFFPPSPPQSTSVIPPISG